MKMTHNVLGWGIIPYSTQLHLLGKRQTDRQMDRQTDRLGTSTMSCCCLTDCRSPPTGRWRTSSSDIEL